MQRTVRAWLIVTLVAAFTACAPGVTGGPDAQSLAEAKVAVGSLTVGMSEQIVGAALGAPGGRRLANCPRGVGTGRCLRWAYTWRPTLVCGEVGDRLSCVQTRQERLQVWFLPAGEGWALAAWDWVW